MQDQGFSFTCKLTTPELRERKATVIAQLKRLIKEKVELSNGYLYRFEGTDEVLDKLHKFIKTERLCCDFFKFELKVDVDSAVLQITGPEEAKGFLEKDIEL